MSDEAASVAPSDAEESFQARVAAWMQACFGPEISADRTERRHRFLEEALELAQAMGGTSDEAHALVEYVFGRQLGEPAQEVGGVMVTLAALCLAAGMDMHGCAEAELARIWTKVDQIRAKQAAKPKSSVAPVAWVHPAEAENARLRNALERIAGSHWERIGYCQTDVEDKPDYSGEQAMQLARAALDGEEADRAAAEARVAAKLEALHRD